MDVGAMAARWAVGMAAWAVAVAALAAMPQLKPAADEIVARCSNPNNGAGAFWCYGAPLIVRAGDEVFASVMEVGEGIQPLCNTRPRLMARGAGKWRVVWRPKDFREREPCPLVLSDGRLLLTVNPLIDASGERRGACRPGIMAFDVRELAVGGTVRPRLLAPDFLPGARFTEHSYRGVGADPDSGEVLVLNIDAATGAYYWAFGDGAGKWTARGRLEFPIRACYPQVAVMGRSAHVLAVGDIYEPVEEWRQYKHEKTGRKWDYVFRRLFYAWTPDILREGFREPVEILNLDATAGHIRNMDLYVDRTGAAHVLYFWQPVQNKLMRDKFFPRLRLVHTIEYALLRDGKLVDRYTVARGGEGLDDFDPFYARFHVSPDGRLFIVLTGREPKRGGDWVMYLLEVRGHKRRYEVAIEGGSPGIVFTASPRSGTKPAEVIDILANGPQPELVRYLQVPVPRP